MLCSGILLRPRLRGVSAKGRGANACHAVAPRCSTTQNDLQMGWVQISSDPRHHQVSSTERIVSLVGQLAPH